VTDHVTMCLAWFAMYVPCNNGLRFARAGATTAVNAVLVALHGQHNRLSILIRTTQRPPCSVNIQDVTTVCGPGPVLCSIYTWLSRSLCFLSMEEYDPPAACVDTDNHCAELGDHVGTSPGSSSRARLRRRACIVSQHDPPLANAINGT